MKLFLIAAAFILTPFAAPAREIGSSLPLLGWEKDFTCLSSAGFSATFHARSLAFPKWEGDFAAFRNGEPVFALKSISNYTEGYDYSRGRAYVVYKIASGAESFSLEVVKGEVSGEAEAASFKLSSDGAPVAFQCQETAKRD